MASREQRLLIASAAFCSIVALAAALLGLEQYLAFATPVLVLAFPLVAGRYLGEARLTRLVARQRGRVSSRPRSAGIPSLHRRERVGPIRGGRLIAASLAVRPPPVAV